MLCHLKKIVRVKLSEWDWYEFILCSGNIRYCPQIKLQEGNVFTPVCHSIHRGKPSLGMPSLGGAVLRGVSMMSLWIEPIHSHLLFASGRYVCYWNAVLFASVSFLDLFSSWKKFNKDKTSSKTHRRIGFSKSRCSRWHHHRLLIHHVIWSL